MDLTAEEHRLRDARTGVPWRFIGPYLSERQWGTVREDYSDNGDAWSYFTHDQARSRAYRWGEDGLAGISDDHQRMCFALAFWNEQDPILKERLYGLTNSRGQPRRGRQGVLLLRRQPADAQLPAVALQVPAAGVPVRRPDRHQPVPLPPRDGVRAARHRRSSTTTATSTSRSPTPRPEAEDIVCRITVHNRGPEAAPIHVLPTLWFRNTWTFPPHTEPPTLRRVDGPGQVVRADHPEIGTWHLHAADDAELLFCDNESNAARLWGAADSPPFPKDGIADHVAARHADRQPRRRGHQGRRPRPPRRAGRRVGVDVDPPDPWRRSRWPTRSPTPRPSSRPGSATPTSSTPPSRPTPSPPTRPR